MLRIDDISFSIQGRPLFEHASASIPTGHKVGLVGPNGAGKTTLFRLIRGELGLDGGTRRIVDLVDQPRGELDELALLVVIVGGRLHIEVGQHAQQRRANIDAFTETRWITMRREPGQYPL